MSAAAGRVETAFVLGGGGVLGAHEIGMLRALGAKRGEIIVLFLAETCVVSALASVIGIGIGLVFAKLRHCP